MSGDEAGAGARRGSLSVDNRGKSAIIHGNICCLMVSGNFETNIYCNNSPNLPV